MSIEKELKSILSKSNTLPFLFVGSGISRRYLDTDDWESLLKKFAVKDINYYKSSSNNDYPLMGSLIAEDFFHKWWASDEYKESREFIKNNDLELNSQTDPLKFEISKHINQNIDNDKLSKNLQKEIEQFKQIKVSGVITTNYDLLIENLFDNQLKRYIGQEEMLFTRSYEIGELYKIHGCCSDFKSIVLTKEDYEHFENTNLFLTSKLLSFFIEYPIIFMGYSFSDSNIHKILENILKSLGNKNVDKLHDRLIFVEWTHEKSSSISETIKSINDINLPITHVKTNTFLPIFKVLSNLSEHLPVHIIRQLKDRLYNVVATNKPTKNILVKENEFEKIDDMEVVFGVGVVNEVSTKGYSCLESYDLFENLIKTEPQTYSPTKMLNDILPKMLRNSTYLPIFQYLQEAEINSSNYAMSELNQKIVEIIEFEKDTFLNKGNLEFLGDDKTVIESYLSSYHNDNIGEIDFEKFRLILKKNLRVLLNKQTTHATNQTDYKRLCCLYDKLKYGW